MNSNNFPMLGGTPSMFKTITDILIPPLLSQLLPLHFNSCNISKKFPIENECLYVLILSTILDKFANDIFNEKTKFANKNIAESKLIIQKHQEIFSHIKQYLNDKNPNFISCYVQICENMVNFSHTANGTDVDINVITGRINITKMLIVIGNLYINHLYTNSSNINQTEQQFEPLISYRIIAIVTNICNDMIQYIANAFKIHPVLDDLKLLHFEATSQQINR
jgi:hypothetical protein